MNALIQYWRDHGTKILGGVTAVVGASGECLALLQTFDPKRAALWGFVITLSVAIVKRGFGNTKQNAQAVAVAVEAAKA